MPYGNEDGGGEYLSQGGRLLQDCDFVSSSCKAYGGSEAPYAGSDNSDM